MTEIFKDTAEIMDKFAVLINQMMDRLDNTAGRLENLAEVLEKMTLHPPENTKAP